MEKNVFNIRETAERLGIAVCTLRSLCKKNRITFRRIGAKVFFTQGDIDEFLESCATKRIPQGK